MAAKEQQAQERALVDEALRIGPQSDRRRFFVSAAAFGAAAAAPGFAQAQAAPVPVLETSEQAQALGYQADSTKIDAKKYPNRGADQSCSGCVLYQGKAGDAAGGCAVFNNNLVAGKGWCGAWTKKG